MSRGVALYLHVHQPYRVKPYSVFDIGEQHEYFDLRDDSKLNNEKIFHKVAEKSYRPMTALLQKLLDTYPGFRFSLSITGGFIDQAEQFAPDVLASFKRLVDTGRVEIVAETYYHSMSFFYSLSEFEAQVELHHKKIAEVFGVEPTAFRNTELAYNDEIAKWADKSGYKAILAEGWDSVLEWRSPNHVYRPVGTENVRLLLKNYHLSDDIAFRFSNQAWKEWPLTSGKYVDWVNSSLGDAPLVNLFMDFETFGEHQWADTGIFTFFEQFICEWLQQNDAKFYTVTTAALSTEPASELSMPNTVTWADSERDLSAWFGNNMQNEAAKHLYAIEQDIVRSGDDKLIADWRNLQSSDHFYYMATKWLSDGDIHAYFSPYDSPYDAFLYYMNAIRDVRWRIMKHHLLGRRDEQVVGDEQKAQQES